MPSLLGRERWGPNSPGDCGANGATGPGRHGDLWAIPTVLGRDGPFASMERTGGVPKPLDMQRHLRVVPSPVDTSREVGLPIEELVELHPEGVRRLLAALDLQNPAAQREAEGAVIDLAVYRATRDRRLAGLFGPAA